MATLQIVPRIPERPTDLISVAVPRLNKQDWISEYLTQLDARDYDINWARVIETKVLTCSEWNDFVMNLLTDRDWLTGRGGTSSWAFDHFEDGRNDWLKLSEPERDLWRKTCYLLVVAVQCAGQTLYIDPEGYNYARYVAFAADVLPEGKTREELQREEQKRESAKREEELKQRIANPPEVPANHGLRFLWNGVKVAGSLTRCYYSFGNLRDVYPTETISLYARDYARFPKEVAACFHVENNSDMQSDFFDDDKLRVCPNHPLYALVKTAYEAQRAHDERRVEKRMQRYGSIDA